MLSMAAFVLNSRAEQTEAIWLTSPKVFIIFPFIEKLLALSYIIKLKNVIKSKVNFRIVRLLS